MIIYSNVTQEDLDNLRKLAEQQKNHGAEKNKSRILKQTHVDKLAESLSPITSKLEETSKKLGDVIKESIQNLGNLIKDNNTPQLAIEITPTTQQPIENNKVDVYGVELENTLNKMKENTGFFKTHYDPQRGWILNIYPIKTPGGTNVKISGNKYDITQGLRKVSTDTKYETAKSMSDTEKVVFKDILSKTNYYIRKLTKGKMSGRDRYIKNDLDNDVIRILNLDTKLKCRGIENVIISLNINDIYTRLEVLLGLKLSGHTDTLTEASNLIDELYKLGEIQNKQQNRNALNKFSKI